MGTEFIGFNKMFGPARGRSAPVPIHHHPIATHLHGSAVLRMLQEEGGVEGVRQPAMGSWPPPDHFADKPYSFWNKVSRGPGGRQVEWPPRPDITRSQENLSQQPDGANMTTTYPSGIKMKDAPEFQQGPGKVVTSQPAFKISQPIRRSGDDKWPPASAKEPTQEEVREFVKPKIQKKNYDEFFAQNALPHNYAAYRPPPGTQHVGVPADDECDM